MRWETSHFLPPSISCTDYDRKIVFVFQRRNSFNLTNQSPRAGPVRQLRDRKKGTGGHAPSRPFHDRPEETNELNNIHPNSHRDYSDKHTAVNSNKHTAVNSHAPYSQGQDKNRVYPSSYNPRDNLVEEESNDLIVLSVGESTVGRGSLDSEWQVGAWGQVSGAGLWASGAR